jgi:activator of HSP90 ATPase
MSQIHQIYRTKESVEKVWKALTNAEEINGWGGGPALMSAEEGSEFKLWDGDIYGKNIKVEPEKLLVQEWYGSKEWKKPSTVEFKFVSDGNMTTIELNHDGIPEDEVEEFSQGWKDYYMGPLIEYVESEELLEEVEEKE